MSSNDNGSNAVNSAGNNLDITKITNEEPEKLASAIESFYKQDGTQKTRLSYHWERNMRFLDGDQWILWGANSSGQYTWNTLQVSKANEYIPRPVTNYLFDAYQTLKSYLTKTKPRSTVRPNTQTFEDKSAAKLANLCIEANYERLKDQENYEYAASILVTYGTVFKKTYWDTSAGDTIDVPGDVPVGAGPDPMALSPEDAGAMQAPTQSIPLGDVSTVVKEPYCMALDPLASDLHTSRWVMEYAIQPLDWIKETYGKSGEGYTGLAETVKSETQLSGSMRRFYQLKNSSGVRNAAPLEGGGNNDTGSQQIPNCAVVKEYYERPSALNPSGRMVVVANGVCLYAGDSPYSGPDVGDWHPYSECRWEIVPGRFWGKSPLDAACDLQKRINSIDATIMLVRKTQAIPQKLLPAGCGIEPGQWTGRPGQVLTYRADAGMPSTVAAAGVDSQVFKEREQCVEDIKTITGAIDILKGDRPPGVNAASALSLLYEVGTGKLFPVLDRWKRFVENDQKKELHLIAKHYQEPREQYISLLKSHNKELSESEISKFIGKDLLDNCNVIVETGSNVPKLESMKQMRLQEAAQASAIDLTSAINRMEYQRQMGITGFDNDVGKDAKRAEWENDCLDNILLFPNKKPVVLQADDDAVHIAYHEGRMKDPVWMEFDPQIQQAYMMHVEEHHNAQMQKQQMEAMNAMAMGQQPGQAGSGMDPNQVPGQGKGAPASVQESAMKADLPPGSEPR
jgi:hypothetical protein